MDRNSLVIGFLIGVLSCTPLMYQQHKQITGGDYCQAFHKTSTMEVHVLNKIVWKYTTVPAVLVMCNGE